MDRSCIESWHSQISDMSDVCFMYIYMYVCVWGDTMRHTCWFREFWQSWGFAWYFPFWGLTLGRIWEVDWDLSRQPNEIPCGSSSCEKNMEFGLKPVGRKKPHEVRQKTPTESLGVEGCGKTEEHGMQWWLQMADKQLYVDYLFDMISFVYYP